MKRVFAITMLTLKAAIRSKLFAGAAVFLFVCMAGLPFLVKGDGTAVGDVRVIIYYNIGIASTLIGLLTLIEACGAVSMEITEKQIQLVRAKPVSSMHIWVGKWFGILCLSAVLVLIAGLTTAGAIFARGFTGEDVQEEVLTARRRLAPEMVSIDREVSHRFHLLKDAGRIAEDADEDEARSLIKSAVIARRTTVGAGEERRWTFNVPEDCSPDESAGLLVVELRSLFHAAYRDEKPMRRSWQILSEGGEEVMSISESLYYDGMNRIALPLELVKGRKSFVVLFRNEETLEGRTVVFNERRGLEVLVTEGGFGMNMLRAMLVIFFITGLMAAIGLTLGSVFSFPVAVFAALSLLIASLTAHFFTTTDIAPHSHEGCSHCEAETINTTGGEKLALGFEYVVGPVLKQKPAEMLSEGLLISWREVWHVAFLVLLLYPAILFVGGSYGLSRRQLALPDTI